MLNENGLLLHSSASRTGIEMLFDMKGDVRCAMAKPIFPMLGYLEQRITSVKSWKRRSEDSVLAHELYHL